MDYGWVAGHLSHRVPDLSRGHLTGSGRNSGVPATHRLPSRALRQPVLAKQIGFGGQPTGAQIPAVPPRGGPGQAASLVGVVPRGVLGVLCVCL